MHALPSVDGHVHLFPDVNNVTMNMGMQISVQVPAFTSFGTHPKMELLNHMASL